MSKPLSFSLVEALKNRRSSRIFSEEAISQTEIQQLLDEAIGSNFIVTTDHKKKVIPEHFEDGELKVGAHFFPFPIAGAELGVGIIFSLRSANSFQIFRYDPYYKHISILDNLSFPEFIVNFFDPTPWILSAPVVLLGLELNGAKANYSNRKILTAIEAGHMLQNIQLVATQMDFKCCLTGAVRVLDETLLIKLNNDLPLIGLAIGK